MESSYFTEPIFWILRACNAVAITFQQPSVITVLGSEEGGPRGLSYGVRLDIWEDQDSEACSHVYMLHILKIPRV